MGGFDVSTSVGAEPIVRYHPKYVAILIPRLGDSFSWTVYLGRVPPKK